MPSAMSLQSAMSISFLSCNHVTLSCVEVNRDEMDGTAFLLVLSRECFNDPEISISNHPIPPFSTKHQ